MEARVNATAISLVRGDITLEETDAIVNAANTTLSGGSGVDGAIHSSGGPLISAEGRKIGSCPTGHAVITSGGSLKARHVIHTVGPVYKDGEHGEPSMLRSAYLSSLTLALEKNLRSVAFPSISTGAYGYPVEEASKIAVSTVIGFIKQNNGLDLVRFVLFSDRDLEVYSRALKGAL